MKRFFWRLGYKFGDNNNMWFLLFWGLFFVSLIFNLFVFGLGYMPPEIELEKESEFFSFKRKEDIVVLPLSLRFWHSAFMVSLWSWMSYLSWMTTFFLFIAALVSFIVLADEIERAFRAANIKLRERREERVQGVSAPTAIPGATPAPSAPERGGALGRPLTFKTFLIWEFLLDFLTELSLFRR